MTKDLQPLQDLLSTTAAWLVAHPDRAAFIDRLAREGPTRFSALIDSHRPPGIGAGQPMPGDSRLFRTFGWAIASATPLPGDGFRAVKLPLPGRNDPCLCGSLRKFKHCCADVVARMPTIDSETMGAFVVAALPRQQWATLPMQKVPPRFVVGAAQWLRDEGRDSAALALLEPWRKLPPPWPNARAELLDMLGDLYLDLGNPRKREQLARDMTQHGGPEVQAKGWQRLSMMASDRGDTDAARQAFEHAQRLAPNDPHLGLLEVTTLMASGQAGLARERAAFHARRLAKLPEAPDMAEVIAVLEELAEEDSELAQRTRQHMELPDEPAMLPQLEAWADKLPPPKLRQVLPPQPVDDLGELQPNATLAPLLPRWFAAFGDAGSRMANVGLGSDSLQLLDGGKWFALLKKHPALADSFEVLDGLVSVLDLVPFGFAAKVQSLLLLRGLDLWQQLKARQPHARCEWGWIDNRPALRLLAHRVWLDDTPDADSSFEWLRHLVEVLNPNDNHGLRQRLAAVYLRRGDAAAALALCERYPDDDAGLELLQARALLALGRHEPAALHVDAALKDNTHMRKLLKSTRARREPQGASYAVGSTEHARLIVSNQHDLWRKDPAAWKWLQARLDGTGGGPSTGDLFAT